MVKATIRRGPRLSELYATQRDRAIAQRLAEAVARGGGGGSRGGLGDDNLHDFNSNLTTAKADQLRLEGELQQVQHAGNNVEALLTIPSIASAPVVNAARHPVTQLEAQITTYALR